MKLFNQLSLLLLLTVVFASCSTSKGLTEAQTARLDELPKQISNTTTWSMQ